MLNPESATKVVVYYKGNCGFCNTARQKLKSICRLGCVLEIPITTEMHENFKNIDWAAPIQGRTHSTSRRQQTVPYIFCDGELIGGCDDLMNGPGIEKLRSRGYLKESLKSYFTI